MAVAARFASDIFTLLHFVLVKRYMLSFDTDINVLEALGLVVEPKMAG